MKLSVPPPPPPPPEPPAPGEQPDPNAPGAATGAPEVPPPEPPAEEPAPKPIKWPNWYGGVDGALAGLTLFLAFMAASFVARNSDTWLHLATGKRLLAGQYTPGSDPFSYSGADRPWVNHSWLTDAGAYLLYGGEGKVLVGAKALVVMVAFGLVLGIRRPKFPLWPWAAVTCVAVLAAAPQFVLRPLVMSMLFLSITLYLVFRAPQKPNSWRFPVAIGVTFWLWANCDAWFFVGPLALALLIVGELIQTYAFAPPTSAPAPAAPDAAPPPTEAPATGPEEEPLGRLPDLVTLAKALGIGVLVCMLNPHHVRVWELPFELVGAPEAGADLRLQQQFLLAPYQDAYRNNPRFGYNLNGLAYAVLLVGGAALLGFGPGRARAAHVALWIGFAGLSLLSVAAVPLFALVAVPLIAAQLNAATAGIEVRSWADPRSRALLIGSSAGRVLCVLGLCALCVLAYPGWVHPDPGSPAFARRVALGVEPDPGLKQAAEQFNKWHESGRLPAEARGLIANLDLANYLAWYAPQEKVFINSRPNHHRAELGDYVAVRRGLGLIDVRDERPSLALVTAVLDKTGAEHLTIQADAIAPGGRAADAVSQLYRDWGEWVPWYIDGRTTVFGWHKPGAPAKPTFADLRVDPVVLAFGPGVRVQPDPEVVQPLPPLGWEEAFVRPVRPTPAGVGEVFGWLRYKDALTVRQRYRAALTRQMFFGFPALSPGALHHLGLWAADGRNLAATPVGPEDQKMALETMPLLWYVDGRGALQFAPRSPDSAADAVGIQTAALLALRAARGAIAKDPDHPDGYLALAVVLTDPDLPLTEGERALGRVIALSQCLARMPAPDRYRPEQFVADPVEVARQLAALYLAPVTRYDQRTKQDVVLGFLGMPLEVEPFGDLLGQAVFEDATGKLHRRPFPLAMRQTQPGLRLVTGNVPRFLPLDTARGILKQALAYAEAAGETSEAAKQRAQSITKLLKDVENALIGANDQAEALKGRSALPDLVEAARHSGLTGKALQLLIDRKDDLAKEYKEAIAYAAALRVSLELALGRIENASELLQDLGSADWTAQFEGAGLGRVLQLLKFQKALHAGEYKAAGEALEGGEGRRVGIEPLMAELAKNKHNPNELMFVAFNNWPPTLANGGLWPAMVFQVALGERAGQAVRVTELIAGKLQADSRFFFRRGVLSLMEGDVPAARQRFLQSRREAPKGWSLRDVAHANAELYLQLIDLAAKKAAP